MSLSHPTWRVPLLVMALCCALGLASVAQQSPPRRSLSAAASAVEKAVAAAGPTNGKLPILDGFVAENGDALSAYRDGYYQLSVKVAENGPIRSTVEVVAKITAWYEGKDSSESGYRALPSNGRLESDFLDRLQRSLPPRVATATPSSAPATHDPVKSSVPDPPSPISSVIDRAAGPSLPTRRETAEFAANAGNERRVQQLKQEINDLQQVLTGQAHPENLVAVKHSGTPVYSRPFDQSALVLRAEAEDEFQIVTIAGSWVHVQVSGLSSGWIKRSDVDLLSNGSSTTVVQNEPAPANNGQPSHGPAYQSREETSMFPGNWAVLRGKTVRIIWVHPSGIEGQGSDRISVTKAVFRKAYPEVAQSSSELAGVVVVFDAEDGGMAATTLAALQQWSAGHLSDNAFWKQCWLDPAEAFKSN